MVERTSGFSKARLIGAVAAIAVAGIAIAAVTALKPATEVIGATEQSAERRADAGSSAAQVLADIVQYRTQSAQLAPDAAAQRWFELYDRAAKLDAASALDLALIDPAISAPVGIRSMFASLPAPQSWQAFRAEATARAGVAKPDRNALALRYLAELLTADRAAAVQTLGALDREIARLPPEEREEVRSAVLEARTLLARLYGSADKRLESLAQSLRNADSYDSIAIPDLVAMVGEQRATELLAGVMMSRQMLSVEGGVATRALVQRLALANIEQMRVPQWQLVDTIDAAPLYEAIEKRFPRGKATDEDDFSDTYARKNAATYYFLAMVKGGRQAEAERALAELAHDDGISIPRDAFAVLQRAGLNEAVYRFLEAQLEKRPQLRAWDVYVEQAAYTGHGANALALIERVLARKDLPDYLLFDLRTRRLSALLAADDVDAAIRGYRELLAKPPVSGQEDLASRTAAALQLAKVGRLLGRKELANLGLDFALRALQVASNGKSSSFELRLPLVEELRRQGRAVQAQEIVIAALRDAPSPPEGFEALLARHRGNGVRTALVELAGLYSAAGQHRDVLELLEKSSRWDAADLAELLTLEDSLHAPLGAVVAQALDATRDKAGALRVARATVAALPGRDAAYEIIANLDPDAADTFEDLYALDEYEERPLIWKAAVLLKVGNIPEAEKAVRRAIAVDPSDGEEGPNDRMRAYAVLSEILRRRGATSDAELFANAVAAIRISERADQLYAAGLLERAFKTYREGLERFSDAYCIQSRLAVQLNKVGRRQEALEHYRRAYELMPGSFGRVESHCFGCESVFADPESQTVAEKVFTDIIRRSPGKAQAHYLLAYLREQQGDYAGAVQPLRAAVSMDPRYLNAWKRLDDIGDKTYLEAGERDIARLKLLELDPLQRHARYELGQVGQLDALWTGVVRAREVAQKAQALRENLLPLPQSAGVREEAIASLPQEMRQQMEMMRRIEQQFSSNAVVPPPATVFSSHALVLSVVQILGAEGSMDRFY